MADLSLITPGIEQSHQLKLPRNSNSVKFIQYFPLQPFGRNHKTLKYSNPTKKAWSLQKPLTINPSYVSCVSQKKKKEKVIPQMFECS